MLSEKKETVFGPGVRIYHVSNSGQVTWAGFARFILEKLGRADVTIEEISSHELNRPAPRPHNSVLSLEKTESTLGVRFRPWEDAVSDFLVELADTKKKEAAKAKEKAEKSEGEPQ
jgi:dTDP-4-dehydrorhamnose reductase